MSRLGRYELLHEIGRGGMGVVYRALDTALNRAVAVKTIALSAQGSPKEAEQLRERLMREAQAAAALSHPNVVAVYDVGQEGDTAYVVMEFVQGGTLDHALAEPEASHSPQALLEVLEQVAHALDYAHAHGIVHRDVKPGNIFLQESGGVKLGDFGVAKVTWSRTMTETGTLVGSPHYMAPEQLKGDRITGKADQFSLAAVAYTVLAGRKPFDADTFATLASRILFEEAPAPSTFGVSIPAEAERVLWKAMSKDPAARFANCTEFIEALEDALRVAEPGTVSPGAARARKSAKWVLPGALAAAVFLVAAAGLFLGTRHQRGVRYQPAPATGDTAAKQVPPHEETSPTAVQAVTPQATPVKPVKPAVELPMTLEKRLNSTDGLTYVRIPPGKFQMGCSPGDTRCEEDEQPPHAVALSKGFWIGQTEVTVAAFQRFVQATGREPPPAPGSDSYWREPKMPILNVTWEEAVAFCQWAGGQLPTEAQWEYAGRAGALGPQYGEPKVIAWYSGDRGSGNSDYKPHPVGQKTPNAFGLYDTLGNAQEWVQDSLHKYDSEAVTDPPASTAGEEHVMRGGGFQGSLLSLRSSFRYRGSGRSEDFGFRCALPLP